MPARLYNYLMLAAVALLAVPSDAGAREPPDRLEEALEVAGWDRDALGCKPRGYWSRFPNIGHIPYLLPFFKDLLAEPLHTYDFARVMAGALEEHLDSAYREKHDVAMFKVVHFLGIEKKVVGPRGYDYASDFSIFATGATAALEAKEPVVKAVERLYEVAGEQLDEKRREQLARDLEEVSAPLQEPCALLLHRLAQAWEWRQIAVAQLSRADMEKIFASRSLHKKEFAPEIDRVGKGLDEVSLYHAAQRTVLAVEKASRALSITFPITK